MILPDEPLYLPFEAGPFRMTLGLVARKPDDLISLDEHYPAQIEPRRTLVAQWGPEVAAAEPGAAPACREMLERLATVLPRCYPDVFETRDDGVHNRITGETWSLEDDPLTTAALLVALPHVDCYRPTSLPQVVCYRGRQGREATEWHGGSAWQDGRSFWRR